MKVSTDVGTAKERLTSAEEEAAALEAELETQIADLAPPPLPHHTRSAVTSDLRKAGCRLKQKPSQPTMPEPSGICTRSWEL
jgi:hypothetical protein